ncbi:MULTISPECIES: GAF domain-containing sensor histidine kinase [Streptomyces]|nr:MULTISPECIES: GAF domain-containing protein [Streptomyces]KEF06624.1 histidine kinase [Streptomyces rimosus]UNZ00796.1 Hypoxia sensor histidine kinase response regulator DosT [Streptomyces rimosus subsp. rimosus]UTH92778.1 Hypoxia sensor histidine kinase response regulator DosT [Streptomyces rimosus subsp. rimosus]UTH99979.1 Hypoxia sensor histidine kinase response regulator DosT [Streptomyces rimosus subsp. rimosus]UTJ10894.1 Hypoxia sensor histidine kinase response regulator DosT [Strepto
MTDRADGSARPTPLPLPQLRLDALLEELQSRLDAARTVQSRMYSLLEAVLGVGRELELSEVLRHIVQAAATLTKAEYGALGTVGQGAYLSDFLPVGMTDELIARIGPLPEGHGILGELIRHPESLRLADLTQHPASHGFPEHHPAMRTFLGVPIRVRGEVFGNLYLTEKRDGALFDADDEAVVSTLAVAAGVAIDNARLYHESLRREQRLEALGEITRSLLSGAGIDEVLGLIARRSLEVAQADSAAVLLPRDADGLTVEVASGAGAALMADAVIPSQGSLVGLAARTGEPVVTRDIRTDPRAYALPDFGQGSGPVVAVPLTVGENTSGALRLSRSAGRPPFDASEVRLVSGFAGQAALALELGRHRKEAEQVALLHDRDRIARDLHDLAIQRLFATGMTLQSAGRLIDRPEAADRVGRAVDDLDETIKIIRSTIFELRSERAPGAGRGLRRLVADVVTAAAEPLGFSPSLKTEGRIDTDIPAAAGEHVLAVLAEVLSNVARHADARHADITLSVADEVVLEVVDDGTGIGGSAAGSGLGNIQQRAELLGGQADVQDRGPTGTHGTRVTWRIPLQPA